MAKRKKRRSKYDEPINLCAEMGLGEDATFDDVMDVLLGTKPSKKKN